MDKIEKFIGKLNEQLALLVIETMEKIAHNDLGDLDIVKMKGYQGWFRCRVGKIRIIFVKSPGGKNLVIDIGFRGSIYKKKR